MKNIKYKNAYTMIELIFVIVLLGILGTVAFNTLSVTRDDAKQAIFATNVSNCISDVGANHIATDNNITNLSISFFSSCDKANNHMASSIEANGTSAIKVSNAGAGLDGVHTFGGKCMICGGF